MTSDLADRFAVRLVHELPGVVFSGVWLADRAGRQVVLKAPAGEGEATALRAWDGAGAVRILDEHDGALLLEYLPGPTLADLDLGQYVEAAADLAGTLWRAPVAGVGVVAKLCQRWETRRRAPQVDVGLAVAQLLSSAPAPVLCHGDLHPGNVIAGARGWCAIDPQPVIAEPAFDVEPLLRRFLDTEQLQFAYAFLARIASHGAPPERVLAWAAVRARWYEAASAGDPDRQAGWRHRQRMLARLSADLLCFAG